MTSSFIGDHKADIGLASIGAGVGAFAGKQIYNYVPTKMVRYVQEGKKTTPYVTDRFIKYAESVSLKDLYSHIDPHTDRSWLNTTKETIKKNALKAKANPKGGERWQFQKIYNLGVKYMTQRGDISKQDLGLARRGANAIYYGRKVEMRNWMVGCAAIGFGAVLLIKKGLEKYKELQNKPEETNPAPNK